MPVNLTTLSNRIGKGGYLLHLVNEFRGATGLAALPTDLPTEWEDFVEQYDSATDQIRACVSNMLDALSQARSGLDGIQSSIADAIQATIIEMVDADAPLSELTITRALEELIAQMTNSADSVAQNTVTVTPSMGDLRTNVGNGVCVVLAKDNHGVALQYAIPEKFRCNVTSTTTAGEEIWTVEGEALVDLLGWEWPGGSGTSQSMSSIGADGSNNLLTNGDFENFTVTNTPDDWDIVLGTVGVHIFEVTTPYTGAKAFKFVSDAATAAQIKQDVTDLLVPRTPYAFNCWLRVNTATAAGSTIIQLWDDDANVPVQDENGIDIQLTVANSALNTSYANYSYAFTIADPLPASMSLRVNITSTTTNTRQVYVDRLSLAEMTRMYNDGPAIAFFSGSINFVDDDNAKVVVTNDLAGKLQTVLWRTCDLNALNLKIPASGTPTVSDSAVS